jgi:uncharacterized protein (DUF58 family)
MTWSPKVGAYALVAAVALAAGLVAGRPATVAFAAPFALLLAFAVRGPGPAVRGGTLRAQRTRTIEGDEVTLHLRLDVTGAERVDVAAPVRPVTAVGGAPAAVPGAPRDLDLVLRARRPAVHLIGPVVVRAVDALGARFAEAAVGAEVAVRVDPRRLALRTPVIPRATAAVTGTHTAASAGEGLEYADVRAHAPGEAVRRVHWRATARHGVLHVTERHPEHQGDVVVLIDRSRGAAWAHDDTTRAAAALTERLLGDRDRVGLLVCDEGVWWLPGGTGRGQQRRIVDALTERRPQGGVMWCDALSVDRRAVPPGALVLAVCPLVEPRVVSTLLGLRGAGHDVAVVEVDPRALLGAARGAQERLVHRLWALELDAHRRTLRRAGIAVATWAAGRPLDEATLELNRWRRAAAIRPR